MRLTVIGSGSAFSSAGLNAGYCLDGRLLIDCGSPAHEVLPRAGIDPGGIETILLTHFHADHTFMLPMFLGRRALAVEEPRPLALAGPPGTAEYVSRLVRVGYGSRLHDVIRERLGLRCTLLQDGSDVDLDGFRVRAHAVAHSTGPSLAYAVTGADGGTVGFSGDTTLCAGLERVVGLVHLMVCECTGWDGPVPSHLWRGEVEELMGRHPHTRFLLTHLPERHHLRGALVAHDLLSLDVAPPAAEPPRPPATLGITTAG